MKKQGFSPNMKLFEIQKSLNNEPHTYKHIKLIGQGTFGKVYKSFVEQTQQIVAIKVVPQDNKHQNRELLIIKQIGTHPNIVKFIHEYYTVEKQQDTQQVYLNLVMECLPMTLLSIKDHFSKQQQNIPPALIKLYGFQLFKVLHYLHSKNIAHRDIKPQNILIDPACHIMKLCDFGSAKQLNYDQPSICYMSARYYRAPELIFGNTNYTTQIDMWSAGCVLAEMVTGQPIFKGASAHLQLVEIIKHLGTPSQDEVNAMNPIFGIFKFANVSKQQLSHILCQADPLLQELISKLIVYDPEKRLNGLQAMNHPYFKTILNTSS